MMPGSKPSRKRGQNQTYSISPGRFLAVLLVSVMAVSMLAPAAMANPDDDLVYGEDGADPLWIDVDTLTVSKHPMDEGGSDLDMAGYEDDDGNWVNGSDSVFIVNTSIGEDVEDDELGNRNPYTFNPAHIEDDDFGAFPRVGNDEDDPSTDASASEDNLASALDASEWTETENASEADITDTTVAADVDAVRFNSGTSMVSGDEYEAQYSNWTSELDSDESKRVIQLSGDVDTLDSATRIDVNITDESGDWKNVQINGSSSASTTDIDVAATGTGSFFYQEKLSDLTTHGGGTWDNIESIEFNASGGDFDVSFSRIDLEAKGKESYGERVIDDDDDDSDYDNTESVYNGTGTISVHTMTEMDPEYDDAKITDVQFPAKFRVQDLQTEGDDEDYRITWETSTKYTRPNVLTVEYRLELPAVVDLSYSGASLEMTQAWPESRYVNVDTFEGADNDAFSTIEDDDNWADQTGSLGAEDEDVELDGSISAGTEYAVKIVSTFSDTEKESLMPAPEGGAAAPPQSGGGGFLGGVWSFITSIPGMLVAVASGILGFKWLRG